MSYESERDRTRGNLPAMVNTALGAASACWSNLNGAGIFESDRCSAIADMLISDLDEYIDNKVQEKYEVSRAKRKAIEREAIERDGGECRHPEVRRTPGDDVDWACVVCDARFRPGGDPAMAIDVTRSVQEWANEGHAEPDPVDDDDGTYLAAKLHSGTFRRLWALGEARRQCEGLRASTLGGGNRPLRAREIMDVAEWLLDVPDDDDDASDEVQGQTKFDYKDGKVTPA